jgi:anti-anti-sigma factor
VDEAFSISTGRCEGFPVLVVRGEIDELTAPELDTSIDTFAGTRPLIVDLSAVEFISSAGLHALLRERPRAVRLVCPQGNVMRLFEIVRANRRVAICESLQAAVADNQKPAVSSGL